MSIIFALNPPGRKMAKRRKHRSRARKAQRRVKRAAKRGKRRNPKAYMARFPGRASRKRSKKTGRSYRVLTTARRVLAQLVARGHAKYGKLRTKRGRAVYVKARNPRRHSRLGSGKYLHMLFRGGRRGGATKAQRKHLVRLKLGRRIPRGPYTNMIKLHGRNPSDLVGLVSTAAGLGAGVVLAQKVIPSLAARISPNLSSGSIGVLVGAVGAIAASKLVARKSPAVAQSIYAGALATIGLSVVDMIVKLLPASIKAPLGLSGLGRMGDVTPVGAMIRGEAMYSPTMGDYMQLSGPVPEQLFAGGLNDYVDFTSPAAGQAAQAISAQIVDWTPTGNEGF